MADCSLRHSPVHGPVDCDGNKCRNCGWNPEEAKRRKGLPLTPDWRGLLCKHVKVTDEVHTETASAEGR